MSEFRKRKRKRKFLCCAHFNSIKQAHEIRKFHVAVMQQGLSNLQKSVMHVQSFFLPILTYSFFLLFTVTVAKTPCCCDLEMLLP